VNERFQELCDKLEALVREYGDVICTEDMTEDICEHGTPPDWSHPLAIQHWALVLTVDDQNTAAEHRGYWLFAVIPPQQRPYITRGMVEEYLDGIL